MGTNVAGLPDVSRTSTANRVEHLVCALSATGKFESGHREIRTFQRTAVGAPRIPLTRPDRTDAKHSFPDGSHYHLTYQHA